MSSANAIALEDNIFCLNHGRNLPTNTIHMRHHRKKHSYVDLIQTLCAIDGGSTGNDSIHSEFDFCFPVQSGPNGRLDMNDGDGSC